MRRISVFERLGPLPEQQAAGEGQEAAAAARGRGRLPPPPGLPPQKQCVALQHPLIAKQLAACQLEAASSCSRSAAAAAPSQHRQWQAGCGGGSTAPGSRIAGSAAAKPLPEQQQRRRQQARRGSSSKPPSSRRDAEQLQAQLRRLQAERDASDEAMAAMAAQTQALLADKAALAAQAAALEAQKRQLEEQLEYLLPAEESEDWGFEGEEEDAACGSGASSGCQPDTPHGQLPEGTAAALQGRLDTLAAERRQVLVQADGSGGPSPGSGDSPS